MLDSIYHIRFNYFEITNSLPYIHDVIVDVFM